MTGAHWLTAERIRLYSFAVIICLASIIISWVAHSQNAMDTAGRPLGVDFITFWAAAQLALEGRAQDAYEVARIYTAEQIAVPGLKMRFAWFYPPSFQLIVLPLTLLPYLISYLTFIVVTLAAYIAAFRQIVVTSAAMWCIAGFSGLWLNAIHGQNAFLTAAIAATALINLERRPALAGILIGLLSIKPQLAVLFPLALIAARAWRTMLVAMMTAVALTALSVFVLGTSVVPAFLAGVATAREALESGSLPWSKMPSVFASLRQLGVSLPVAYCAHFAVASAAAALVWCTWRVPADAGLRSGILMTATFLISPYVYDYDLAWLAFPVAWYVKYASRHGWQWLDREIFCCVWFLPIVLANLTLIFPVPVGPPVLCGLLFVLAKRVL